MKYDNLTANLLKDIERFGFLSQDKLLERNPSFTFRMDQNDNGGGTYIGKSFVVKQPYIVSSVDPPKKVKCPTLVVGECWVQPKCKVFKELPEQEKQKFIDDGQVAYDTYGELYLVRGIEDCHDGNFGVLRGKLRQFDW